MRGVDVDVVVIGDTTCGKPYGFYPASNCGETYYSIQFQGVNNKGFGDYADGFAPVNSSDAFAVKTPGCSVGDDLSRELGDPNEALLSAALQYRQDSTCPAPSASSGQSPQSVSITQATDVQRDLEALAITAPAPGLSEVNRDMTLPRERWETGR